MKPFSNFRNKRFESGWWNTRASAPKMGKNLIEHFESYLARWWQEEVVKASNPFCGSSVPFSVSLFFHSVDNCLRVRWIKHAQWGVWNWQFVGCHVLILCQFLIDAWRIRYWWGELCAIPCQFLFEVHLYGFFRCQLRATPSSFQIVSTESTERRDTLTTKRAGIQIIEHEHYHSNLSGLFELPLAQQYTPCLFPVMWKIFVGVIASMTKRVHISN